MQARAPRDEDPGAGDQRVSDAGVPAPTASTPLATAQHADPSRRYPDWLKRSLMLGGVVAILVAGTLLHLGFFATQTASAGLRAAAQIFGVSSLGLGLLAIIVPYADHRRIDDARRP